MTTTNKTPSKVTAESISRRIVSTEYYRWPGKTLTLALITLDNGFTSLGQSACVDPANYDEAIGKKLARQDAFNQLWKLECYLLAERRYAAAERAKNEELLASVTCEPAHDAREYADYLYMLLILGGPGSSLKALHPKLGMGMFYVRYGLYNLWFKPQGGYAVELACPPAEIPSGAQLHVLQGRLFIPGYRYTYDMKLNAWSPLDKEVRP